MKYIKILVLLAGVVAGSNMLCNAQGGKKAMVDCYTSKDALKSIVLKSVKDGKTWRLAEGMCLNDDYFGFGCVPTYSGIYVVGDGKFMEYPIYLKGGERLSLYLDQDTVYLTGKKCSRENKILYEWLADQTNCHSNKVHVCGLHRLLSDVRGVFEESTCVPG